MKTINTIIFLLIIFTCQACKKENPAKMTDTKKTNWKADKDSTIQDITNFYTAYFTEMENTNKNSEKKLNLLKQKYMSSQLYEKLKNIDLDYDPVINGQDVDPNWKKTLKITHIKEEQYEMCIKSSSDNSSYCTYLKIGKIQGENKITDIKVNDIASILKYSNSIEINNLRTENQPKLDGKWQFSCDTDASYIEFYDETSASIDFKTKSNLLARTNLRVNKTNNTYQLFFDGLTGVTRGNPDLDWDNLSREQAIAEITPINNTLKFQWLGFYNSKTKEREYSTNPLYKHENPSILIKCLE